MISKTDLPCLVLVATHEASRSRRDYLRSNVHRSKLFPQTDTIARLSALGLKRLPHEMEGT